jgi:hypothetical protein
VSEIAIDFLMGPDASSKLISWFGTGPGGYSHCAGVLADGRYIDARNDTCHRVDKTCNVPDIVLPGVHIRDPKSEKWIRKCRATLAVTQNEYAEWERNARDKIGDSYGRSDIMEFIFDRGTHEPGHYICSAFQINELQHIQKVPFPLWLPAHQISPNMALSIVQTAGFTIGPVQVAA